ncbi:MAG: pilus assembly protein FimV, partial [Gammaproteobacteria bacterium]
VDEAITSLDLTETSEKSPISEPIETEIPPAVSTTQTETMAMEAGLVDQILRFVFGNIMLVGGAIGAIILGVLGFLFIRKRKGESADGDETVAVTDFPDFESTAEATDMPESSSEMDVEAGVVDENDADKNVLIGDVEPDQPSSEIADTPEIEVDAVEEPEDDPLAEVNVFLAYEHFDQAEEFVRDAITNSPENLDFHSKLLEVFYSSGDKVKYEEEARVVNDLVNGEGPHWEMAQIMWQEISPNRALFAEPTDGESDEGDAGEAKAGGIVDLTADDEADEEDGALDFDLGMGGAEDVATNDSEDVLDITSGSDDVLDITGDVGANPEEDLLDITAAVGLDAIDNVVPADEEDFLDISTKQDGEEDLLDVTAHTDLDADDGEDLLDVTAATDTSSVEEESVDSLGSDDSAIADDNALDFDIGGLDVDSTNSDEVNITSGENKSDENIIDFDSSASDSADEDGGIELDLGVDSSDDGGLEISLDGTDDDAGGIELDLGVDSSDDGGLEISLDGTDDDAGGIELDLGVESGDDGIELDMEIENEPSDGDISLDMDIEEEASVPEIEMDSTVKIPNEISIELDSDEDDDDDDDEDHTVFVPRTSDTSEQSVEDEVATKLDLAKAYVELGDNDSASTILDEIIAEGNDAQRQQAEKLKSQLS